MEGRRSFDPSTVFDDGGHTDKELKSAPHESPAAKQNRMMMDEGKPRTSRLSQGAGAGLEHGGGHGARGESRGAFRHHLTNPLEHDPVFPMVVLVVLVVYYDVGPNGRGHRRGGEGEGGPEELAFDSPDGKTLGGQIAFDIANVLAGHLVLEGGLREALSAPYLRTGEETWMTTRGW